MSQTLAPEFYYTILGAFVGFFLFAIWRLWEDRRAEKHSSQRALGAFLLELVVNNAIAKTLSEQLESEINALAEKKGSVVLTPRFATISFHSVINSYNQKVLSQGDMISLGVTLRFVESVNLSLDARDNFKMTNKALTNYGGVLAGIDSELLAQVKGTGKLIDEWISKLRSKVPNSILSYKVKAPEKGSSRLVQLSSDLY